MFNSKKNQDEEIQYTGNSGKTSMIGDQMVITGDIDCSSDVRIDGRLVGNIRCAAKVVIGSEGEVQGNIFAKQADITGNVTGNLEIEDLLTLHKQANIKGDIVAQKISMEPTVTFNGKCTMKAGSHSNVLEMSA